MEVAELTKEQAALAVAEALCNLRRASDARFDRDEEPSFEAMWFDQAPGEVQRVDDAQNALDRAVAAYRALR